MNKNKKKEKATVVCPLLCNLSWSYLYIKTHCKVEECTARCSHVSP